jgi:ubiquitin carboxyl-terminal hydrolase 10
VQVGRAGSSEASQQVLLEALPPVLVLHLERFLYDATADGINKINKPVRFAPELEIPPGTILSFLSPPFRLRLRMVRGSVGPEIMVPVAGKSAEPVHYKLYGVLYHHGESAGSGHYTVDLLHPNADSGTSGDAWLHINDEDVNVVPHEDVFVGHDNARVDNQCAYMLFYCRITPAWTS